jgi:branched-chain amino acid aminotransferase
MSMFASVDGRVLPIEEARVSVLDNGFAFGDSVYETLRTYGGRPFHLDRHSARLRRSAGRLGIEIPLADAALASRLDEVLEKARNTESYIRIIVSRGVGDMSYRPDRVVGPTVVVIVKPLELFPDTWYTDGIEVAVVSVRRNHPDALDPAIKSSNLLNNILAIREAQARGAAEAILLNQRGEVAEGTSSNVFVVREGRVATPPLHAGILPGITREVVLELCAGLGIDGREETLAPESLAAADEVFMTSTLKEAAPVRRIDGKAVGSGKPGPVTLRILSAFRDYAPRHCG